MTCYIGEDGANEIRAERLLADDWAGGGRQSTQTGEDFRLEGVEGQSELYDRPQGRRCVRMLAVRWGYRCAHLR